MVAVGDRVLLVEDGASEFEVREIDGAWAVVESIETSAGVLSVSVPKWPSSWRPIRKCMNPLRCDTFRLVGCG